MLLWWRREEEEEEEEEEEGWRRRAAAAAAACALGGGSLNSIDRRGQNVPGKENQKMVRKITPLLHHYLKRLRVLLRLSTSTTLDSAFASRVVVACKTTTKRRGAVQKEQPHRPPQHSVVMS